MQRKRTVWQTFTLPPCLVKDEEIDLWIVKVLPRWKIRNVGSPFTAGVMGPRNRTQAHGGASYTLAVIFTHPKEWHLFLEGFYS